MTTIEAPISYGHAKARRLAAEAREWARKAGPVIRVQAMRCECGGWMRPGIDHICDNRPAEWRHTVRHRTGEPARCSCGWATPRPVPVPWVELIARAHLSRTDLPGDQRRCSPSRTNGVTT